MTRTTPGPGSPDLPGADEEPLALGSAGTLLEALDRLIDRGTVVRGNVLLSIADVDLIRLDLGLLLASIESLERSAPPGEDRETPGPRTGARSGAPDRIASEPPLSVAAPGPRAASEAGAAGPPAPAAIAPIGSPRTQPTRRVEIDPTGAERGLAQLVLGLVDFIRRLLERQAIRRMEGGRIDDGAIERMGVALERLEQRVVELAEVFGLEPEELDLDLGPLGRLHGESGKGAR